MQLTTRQLNRALLARQLLLERHPMSALDAVEHLVGLQAQAPNAPYVGLWSRLDPFDPDEIGTALTERRGVRTSLMRSTVHLVTSDDCLGLRPLVDTVLRRQWSGSSFAKALAGADIDAIVDAGRALVEDRPRTHGELTTLLGQQWPDKDAVSLAYTVAYLLPLVQVPPRGVWGKSGPAARTTVAHWLAGRPRGSMAIDTLVTRYLAAFGPASVMDMQTWSGLSRLREVFDRTRPQLATFRDENDRELYDVPDASRPDPATPASPRFLPEYDNLLLSHRDRSRVIHGRRRVPLPPGDGGVRGTFLVDGFMAGTWRLRRAESRAALRVEPYESMSPVDAEAIEAEGLRLLAFIAADSTNRHVELAPTA